MEDIRNEEAAKINIREIIDLDFLQKFQDDFSAAVGVASIAVDIDGNPITTPSGFTDFCMKLVRGSTEGMSRCAKCDAQGGTASAQTGKPAIYDCHAGLVDFAAPIMLKGKQIGSLLGGQVLTSPLSQESIRKIASEINTDEKELQTAASQIAPVSKEKIQKAADLLYLVANNISEMGYQKNRVRSSIEVLDDNLS